MRCLIVEDDPTLAAQLAQAMTEGGFVTDVFHDGPAAEFAGATEPYDVAVLASVTTVLFNGNPLLRYDGYFVAIDALEIPNLAQRAGQWWGYVFERFLLARRSAVSPAPQPISRMRPPAGRAAASNRPSVSGANTASSTA